MSDMTSIILLSTIIKCTQWQEKYFVALDVYHSDTSHDYCSVFLTEQYQIIEDFKEVADDSPDYKNLISPILGKSSNGINKFIQETVNGPSQYTAN